MRSISAKLTKLHLWLLAVLLASFYAHKTGAQSKPVIVNLATLDGQELTPDNIFNYSVQSFGSSATEAVIKGRLLYRASGLSFSYSYRYTLKPGMNAIDPSAVHAQWTYSSTAFRELFADYKKLPAGMYSYCVEVIPTGMAGEPVSGGEGSDCIYGKSNEVFLINLVDPENGAKLHEDYPVLSWTVNYPFVSALTYRVRVAEIKEGQNNTAAVNRNNPWYAESNLTGLSVSYPVYGKPLEKWQPYAWTVDAYYKGILLGGAEPWRFTIVDDSELNGLPKDMSHVDIRREQGLNTIYAVGKIKLKYVIQDVMNDALQLELTNAEGKTIKLKNRQLAAVYGDNRYEIPFAGEIALKHLNTYYLKITNGADEHFTVKFRYVNPDFL